MEFIELDKNRYLVKGSNGLIVSKEEKEKKEKESKNGDNFNKETKPSKKTNNKSKHTRD